MERADLRAIALVILVSVAVFGASVSWDFVWDDEDIIVQRAERFADWENLPSILIERDTTTPGEKNPYYRPVMYFSFFADMNLWGLNPFGYHLENVLLHVLVSVLFYVLVLRIFEDRTIALFSALIMAVHPVNAEAVNFISAGRKSLLSATFMLGSLVVLAGGVPSARRIAGSLVLYALALLSVEQAVVLPFFLLLLYSGRKVDGRAMGPAGIAAFFGVTAVYFLVRLAVLGTFTSETPGGPWSERAGLVSASLFEYFRLLVLPVKLNASYRVDTAGLLSFKTAVAVSGTAILVILSLMRSVPGPLRWGALWISLSLLPVINIIPIPSSPVAERYLYIPALGFALIVAYPLTLLYRKKAVAALAIVVVLTALMGARSFTRSLVWKDELSLYKSMIASDPENPKAHFNLGNHYVLLRRTELAQKHWESAILIEPRVSDPYNSLGNLNLLKRDYPLALAYYERAIALDPGNFIVHYNLGVVLERLGDVAKALGHYRTFIRKAESSPKLPMYEKNLMWAKRRASELEGEAEPRTDRFRGRIAQ